MRPTRKVSTCVSLPEYTRETTRLGGFVEAAELGVGVRRRVKGHDDGVRTSGRKQGLKPSAAMPSTRACGGRPRSCLQRGVRTATGLGQPRQKLFYVVSRQQMAAGKAQVLLASTGQGREQRGVFVDAGVVVFVAGQ